jgi:acid phosphatase
VTRRNSVAALAAVLAAAAVAPSAALGVRFVVKGDWGAGTKAQAAVTSRMCTEYDRAQFAFILTTGDNFYPTGTATTQTFTEPERCLWTKGLRWRAAWGNHDIPSTSTRDLLKTPARWYTFVSGPVRVIVLDSNQASSRSQITFLRRALEAETVRPVIVAYHHPARTAGTHAPSSTLQRNWEPLFVTHKVKLVLQGHNHLYERIAHRGVTYVTTGGGGAGLYPCVRQAAGLVTCRSVHHFLAIEVTPRKIGVRAIGTDGALIDRFRFALTVAN